MGQIWDFFKIIFSTFWLGEPKCTETDLKKSQMYPIWDQSDPIRMPNLTCLPCTGRDDVTGALSVPRLQCFVKLSDRRHNYTDTIIYLGHREYLTYLPDMVGLPCLHCEFIL